MANGKSLSIKEIDELYHYQGGDLGCFCSEKGTVFKVWSPFAEKIELHLYRDEVQNGDRNEDWDRSQDGDPGGNSWNSCTFEMKPMEKGVWERAFPECLHGTFYDYTVWIDGCGRSTADPYAFACSCNGQKSMAVDLSLTDPEGFKEDTAPPLEKEQIIYELHVKDFSYDKDSGIPEEYRGKYKAFTVSGTNGEYPTCMEYLKRLGITHVHLLPIFDYSALDEAGGEKQYNWGYDPMNYNVPEGSYSTDPFDGAVRIRECKEMVQDLHKNGIRVIMDVVYNHTYSEDSWLDRMVPGYYYRCWGDGTLSDGSACGNDIASGRAMVDDYIVDSILYWAREYHIDGFRFDLMGLLTVELMNRIREVLDAEFGKGEKLLYGEPWRAKESPMEEGTMAALKSNISCLDEGISVFCDDTRDVIKGHVFYEEVPGFVNGARHLEERLLCAVTGWRRKEMLANDWCRARMGQMGGYALKTGTFDEPAWEGNETGEDCPEPFLSEENAGKRANVENSILGSQFRTEFEPKSCAQVINYVSAHDNFTLWDKLVLSMHGEDGRSNENRKESISAGSPGMFQIKYRDVLAANKLAAFIYFTCQGNLFLQAGEEFGRTKYGDSNSFRSCPEVNMLKWRQTVDFSDLVSYYSGLIRLRKRLPGLYDKSADAAKRIMGEKVHGEGLVSFLVDNRRKREEGSHRKEAFLEGASSECVSSECVSSDCADSEKKEFDWLFIVYNACGTAAEIELPPGEWTVLADGIETDCRKKVKTDRSRLVRAEARSGLMLGGAGSLQPRKRPE